MKIGDRVILNSLLWEGDFPGEIYDINPITGLCTVKIDRQKNHVLGVVYFKKRPIEVNSIQWQICFPLEGEK